MDNDVVCWNGDNNPYWTCAGELECSEEKKGSKCDDGICCKTKRKSWILSPIFNATKYKDIGISFVYHRNGDKQKSCYIRYSIDNFNSYTEVYNNDDKKGKYPYDSGPIMELDKQDSVRFALVSWEDDCRWDSVRIYGTLIVTENSMFPTNNPSSNPSEIPSIIPTESPIKYPTNIPTIFPTDTPTQNPTNQPSNTPMTIPSKIPTMSPTILPSYIPTFNSTLNPSNVPIYSTYQPTHNPTYIPAFNPTNIPLEYPAKYLNTTPSIEPTNIPSVFPTKIQIYPTDNPTFKTLPPTINTENQLLYQPRVSLWPYIIIICLVILTVVALIMSILQIVKCKKASYIQALQKPNDISPKNKKKVKNRPERVGSVSSNDANKYPIEMAFNEIIMKQITEGQTHDINDDIIVVKDGNGYNEAITIGNHNNNNNNDDQIKYDRKQSVSVAFSELSEFKKTVF